VRSAAK